MAKNKYCIYCCKNISVKNFTKHKKSTKHQKNEEFSLHESIVNVGTELHVLNKKYNNLIKKYEEFLGRITI